MRISLFMKKRAMARHSRRNRSLIVLGLCLLLGAPAQASAVGDLNGVVRDTAGNPLPDLLVALIAKSAETIPVLTRTDEAGRLFFRNVQAGAYQLLVRSSAYESPSRLVEITAGKTLSISLVLQQLLSLGPSDQRNVGIKTLLRSSDGRLIFRTRSDPAGLGDADTNPFFENASVEVYANSGVGDGILSPLDFPGGTTTSFAVKRSMVGGNDYYVAGQFNSGPNSFWRFKNQLDYQLSDNHSIELFVGYGRLSLEDAGRASANAAPEGPDAEYGLGAGTARVASFGFEDNLRFGDMLSVVWGLELNQVRRGHSRYFVNPNAEISVQPFDRTSVRLLMASKRDTQGNVVSLPDQESINLSDAVYFSLVDDNLSVATARYYEASLTQELTDSSSLELAGYRSRVSEAAVPYFVLGGPRTIDTLRLSGRQADDEGYRATYRQRLGDNFRASVSYTHGEATGLDAPANTLLIDRADLGELLRRRGYHALATQIEAFVPISRTHVTAVLKRVVSGGTPLTTLDALSDQFETSNQGINLFVRQLIPVPTSLLSYLGLDFLSAYRIEALLDIRNLANDDIGLVPTADGTILLVQNPRSVRGGIALNF